MPARRAHLSWSLVTSSEAPWPRTSAAGVAEHGPYAGRLPQLADLVFVERPQVGQLRVGEAELLGPSPLPGRQRMGDHGLQRDALVDDHRHLVEEPRIDPGAGGQVVHRDAPPQCLAELEDALRRGDGDGLEQLVVGQRPLGRLARVGVEPVAADLQRTQRLLQALGERAADGHRLAHALHLRAEDAGRAGQLFERPAGDLRHDVVDARLEAGRRLVGDVVGDLVQGVADGQASRDLGDGEAREARPTSATRGSLMMTWRRCGSTATRSSRGLRTDATRRGGVPHVGTPRGERVWRGAVIRVAGWTHQPRLDRLHHDAVVGRSRPRARTPSSLHRRLDQHSRIGLAARPAAATRSSSSVVEAKPVPRPPRM